MAHRPEVADADESLQAAADRMRSTTVGLLPVTSCGRLVGVVTDRDLAVRGLARNRDARSTPVRVVMTPEVISCLPDEDLSGAVALMARHGVRRLVVIDHDGQLAGVLSIDDLALAGVESALLRAVLTRVPQRRSMETDLHG
jgi:CBS domain-containing protein